MRLFDIDSKRLGRWESILAQSGPRLRSFVRRRVPDAAEAEDLLQEVWVELWEALGLPNEIEEAGAWLYRVARNRITDFFRRKRPLPFSSLAPAGEEATVLEDLFPSKVRSPESELARRVLAEELLEALEELPAAQREVFVEHEFGGKSFKQMAEEKKLPLNTLLGRKHEAVRFLRERLKDIYEDTNERKGGTR